MTDNRTVRCTHVGRNGVACTAKHTADAGANPRDSAIKAGRTWPYGSGMRCYADNGVHIGYTHVACTCRQYTGPEVLRGPWTPPLATGPGEDM